MKHGEISHPRLKALCLNGVATSHITQAQAALLACFVETYLPLTQAEQEKFERLIQHEEVRVMEFITSWERKGRTEEARHGVLEQLQEKFGPLPEITVQHVEAISSIEELRRLRRQLVHANSLAEMGLDGAKE